MYWCAVILLHRPTNIGLKHKFFISFFMFSQKNICLFGILEERKINLHTYLPTSKIMGRETTKQLFFKRDPTDPAMTIRFSIVLVDVL